MKVFICAVIALSLLTGGVAWFCLRVESVCDSLLDDASVLKTKIMEKDGSCESFISDMQKKWEKNIPFFMAFSEHGDINSVTSCLSDMKNRVFLGDFSAAYCVLSDFKHRISAIASDSKPTLINIF